MRHLRGIAGRFQASWPSDLISLNRIDANMISAELLKILVCPENQSSLNVASTELLARLNRAIASGKLSNRAGQKVERPLGAGLLRQDERVLYPIVDEIPMLLVDEGILLDQPALAL
jgi:uncharacterized protein YbaR (Trm112 family)